MRLLWSFFTRKMCQGLNFLSFCHLSAKALGGGFFWVKMANVVTRITVRVAKTRETFIKNRLLACVVGHLSPVTYPGATSGWALNLSFLPNEGRFFGSEKSFARTPRTTEVMLILSETGSWQPRNRPPVKGEGCRYFACF